MFRKSNSSRRIITLALGTLLTLGCTMRTCSSKKDISPEDQLHSYINTAVNITSPEERDTLLALTSGELKRSISAATDQAFKTAYIDKKYDFRGFEIVERRDVEPDRVIELDFRLNYKSWSAGEEPELVPFVETLNRAKLVYEQGRWVLASVQSLETSFDWEVGLPLDNVDTSGVTPEDAPKEIQSSRDELNETSEETPQAPSAPESPASESPAP